MDHLGAAIGPLLATLFLLRWPNQLQPLFLLSVVPGLAVVALLLFGLREVPLKKPAHCATSLDNQAFRLALPTLPDRAGALYAWQFQRCVRFGSAPAS